MTVGHNNNKKSMFIEIWNIYPIYTKCDMNIEEQHLIWKDQVGKLKESLNELTSTDPKNIIQHFFLQALQTEFSRELESNKKLIENILCFAIQRVDDVTGTPRQRAAQIVKEINFIPILGYIRLSDLRNKAVFEVYRQCGITIDTYFERYSSPPGNAEQNACYSNIAHGNARATARQTTELSNILNWMQILKRFFIVYDSLEDDVQLNKKNLNWIGAMWKSHIDELSLGDLIWELFQDLWHIEN